MVCLEAKNVSIRYITGDFKEIGLKEYAMRRLKGDYHVQEFWADRNISFRLEEGEMLGIIGTNGAGKSTLLKTISGIMEPSEGVIHREGSIAALLELGSGFDGDLTVRENTYLRGAMMGYTRKFMDETYNQIIEFAELQAFQDRPFKQLSSGMKSRLAFSIASLVRPDILILDEVLAVGDGAFRKKSEAKMREIIESGATTILVSHSLVQIRELCSKVLWLHKGRQVAFGDNVKEICDQYQRFLNGGQKETDLPKFVAMQSLPLPAELSGQEQANTKEQYQKHDGTDMKQNASMPSVPEEIMGQEDTLMQVKEKIPWKALTFIFLISVIFRGILASNIGEYAVFHDELVHPQIAHSIANGRGIFIRGALYDYTEILYSLVISPAFILAKNTGNAHQIILWMNVIMMSSAIYPIYMLAKKYLKKPLHIWMIALYGILIGEMSYTVSVIQENLNYPLMMWFFFLFSEIVIDRDCPKKGLCILGAYVFLLTTCKQMNLIIPITVALFFLIQIIIAPKEKVQSFKSLFLFSSTFLLLKLCYSLLMGLALTDAIEPRNVLNNLNVLFNIAKIKQLIYPAIAYLVFTLLATGIFPIIMSIGNFKDLSCRARKMLTFVLCNIFVAVATICILIVQDENLGSMTLRFHSRYYFYTFILIAMLFLECCENLEIRVSDSRATLFLTVGYGLLLTFMPVVPVLGSAIDGISTLSLRLLSGGEVETAALRCMLLGITVLGCYCIYKRRYRVICGISVLVLIIELFGGTYVSSSFAYNARKAAETDKQDAILLNDYFKQKEAESGVLLVGKEALSDAVLECYLDTEYCYALEKNVDVGKSITMDQLPLLSCKVEWHKDETALPDYIVSKDELPIQGFEKVETGMQNHQLLQRCGEKAWLEYKESDVWRDRWIGETAGLEIAGTEGRSDAILTLTVDNIVVGDTVSVTYSDSSGFTGNFEIPPTAGEKKTVQIPVHKPTDSTSYSVTFTSSLAKQPGTADTRYLSFRLWEAELQEKAWYKEDGIWTDRWIGGTASLEMEGTVGSSDAILTLSVDNILLGETAVVTYHDSSGFVGSFEIPPTVGTRETVQIPIHKPEDNAFYYLTFTSEQTKQPGTDDTRYLTFRLWDVLIQELK